MVGTFAGGGFYLLGFAAAALVVVTNIAMRSVVLGIHRRQQAVAADDGETQYTIAVTCRSAEEAHVRSLLLHALSQGGLGLRRIESEDLPDSGKVCVTAETPAVSQGCGFGKYRCRLSLETYVTAVSWEAGRVNGDV